MLNSKKYPPMEGRCAPQNWLFKANLYFFDFFCFMKSVHVLRSKNNKQAQQYNKEHQQLSENKNSKWQICSSVTCV